MPTSHITINIWFFNIWSYNIWWYNIGLSNIESYARWFFVTFSSPSWRSLNHFKRSLNHPKQVTSRIAWCIYFLLAYRPGLQGGLLHLLRNGVKATEGLPWSNGDPKEFHPKATRCAGIRNPWFRAVGGMGGWCPKIPCTFVFWLEMKCPHLSGWFFWPKMEYDYVHLFANCAAWMSVKNIYSRFDLGAAHWISNIRITPQIP